MTSEATPREIGHRLRRNLSVAFLDDTLDATTLDVTLKQVEDLAKVSRRLPSRYALMDELAFYDYVLSGKEPVKHTVKTSYDLIIAAIQALYQGQADKALDAFRSSTDRFFSGALRNLPDNLLAAYFNVIALYKSGGKKDVLQRIVSDNDVNPVIKLLASFRDKPKDQLGAEIRRLLPTATALEKQILFLISKSAKLSNLQGYNRLEAVPHLAIMRNECAPFTGLDADEHESLIKTFGGESLIANLPEEETWVSALAGLESVLAPARAKGSRVKFIFFDGSIIGLREQKAMPDGTWGEDRLLSYTQYLDCQYPFMDEADQKIAYALKEYGRVKEHPLYRNEGEVILPFLVGSDRVYGPHGPITISAEKPRVTFKVDVDRINPTSNVDSDKSGKVWPCKVITDAEGNCTVISMDQQQRKILEMLLKTRGLPLSAAQSVIELGERMEGQIEADTSQIKALSNATETEGSGKIVVLLTPDKTNGSFKIEWAAAPYGSAPRFTPSEGSAEFVVVEGDSSVRIKRDLQKELDNQNDLTDFITALPGFGHYNGKTLVIKDMECLLQLLEFLHDRPDDYAMEWPEGSEIKFKGKASKGAWEIGLTASINWFGVDGTLNLGNSKLPLKEVMKASLNDESEYVRIGEQEYIKISRALKKQLAALQALGGDSDLEIPKYQVGKLAEILGMGELPAVQDGAYAEQLHRMQEAYEMTPEVPETLNATLRDYQLEGFRWMFRLSHWGAGGCLADDMGLGKTVQTIAFLLSQKDKGPSLVIAPTSVVPNWEKELRKFAPDELRPVIINDVRDRALVVNNAKAGDVILSSYGVLTNSTEALLQRDWNVIILDEAHQIKNRWTKVSKAAMDLKGNSRFILTGTPVQNSLSDLWNLFQFINPGMLGKFEQFKAKYSSHDDKEASEKMEMLKSITQPFILRRTKENVLEELPKKTEFDYIVPMTANEQAYYEKLRSGIEDVFAAGSNNKNSNGGQALDITFFEGLTKLRLACCSLELQNPVWAEGSSKIRELKFILQRIFDMDTRMLIFSQFTSFLGLVKPLLKDLGIPFLYLDGSTPLDQRSKMVEQFQNGESQMFLISLKAGGLGLNLTAANHVILLDPWWNPSIEEQAIDRAYRIGQMRDVTVIRLIAAQTIEEKIVKLQEFKKGISDNILEGTGNSGKLTYEEIMEMVSPF